MEEKDSINNILYFIYEIRDNQVIVDGKWSGEYKREYVMLPPFKLVVEPLSQYHHNDRVVISPYEFWYNPYDKDATIEFASKLESALVYECKMKLIYDMHKIFYLGNGIREEIVGGLL